MAARLWSSGASNTTGNLFKYLGDQKTYVLLGGRWFRSASIEGRWGYVPGAKLPKDFTQIPDKSRKENVKAAVPGTAQAQEALIENGIPTMAKIERDSVKLDLTLDGDPQLQAIQGTPLRYATNANVPLIMVAARSWYACQNGVWFSAPSVDGPWAVADSVPAEIYSIPPSSPLFYATYVRAYGSTTDAVYYGYTPGYFGTAVSADGVTVFGTGYGPPLTTSRYWYVYPVTYGVGATMVWTPWSGWGFSYGFGWGWGYAWYPVAPWWGPYHDWAYNAYGGMGAWGPGGWASTSSNIYGRRGDFQPGRQGAAEFNAFTGNRWATQQYGQAYNSVTGALLVGQKGVVENVYSGNHANDARGMASDSNASVTAHGGQAGNSVFAAKEGGVYEQQDDGGWKQVAPGLEPGNTSPSVLPPGGTTNSTGASSTVPGAANPASLDGQSAARRLGDLRANTFQSMRP